MLALAPQEPWSSSAVVLGLSIVKFDQILALAPLEPWSTSAVILGLSSCII